MLLLRWEFLSAEAVQRARTDAQIFRFDGRAAGV